MACGCKKKQVKSTINKPQRTSAPQGSIPRTLGSANRRIEKRIVR